MAKKKNSSANFFSGGDRKFKSALALLAAFAITGVGIYYFLGGSFAANQKFLNVQRSDVTYHIVNWCYGNGKAGVTVVLSDRDHNNLGFRGVTDSNGDVTFKGVPYGMIDDETTTQHYRTTRYREIVNQPTHIFTQLIYPNTMADCAL